MTRPLQIISLFLLLCIAAVQTNAQTPFGHAVASKQAPLASHFIKDLDPSTAPVGTGAPLVTANNKLFFRNSTVNADWGFWASDGTQAGTVELRNAYPSNIVATDTYAFAFFGGEGIWVSDGTVEGTRQLNFPAELQITTPQSCPGNSSAAPTAIGSLLFLPSTALWRTDGRDEGTIKLATFDTYSCGTTAVNGHLFFDIRNELWKSDGTIAGTTFVATIPTASPTEGSVNFLTGVDDKLFFLGPESTLWVSNGTTSGTTPLKSFPGTVSALMGGNGVLFFILNSTELWVSDGTAEGTVAITNLAESVSVTPRHLVANNQLYLMTSGGIWVSDGSSNGTQKIISGSFSAPYGLRFAPLDNHVFFMWTQDEENGENVELWQSDGTAGGTQQVTDINPGNRSSYPSDLIVYNNQLYFFASRFRDRELWRSDGTAAGTVLAADVNKAGLGSEPHSFMRLNEQQFVFLANTPERDNALWLSNGSASGTTPVSAENEVEYVGQIREILTHDGTIYFAAGGITNSSASQLWRSDGTAAGTELVIDLRQLDPPVTSPLEKLFWFGDHLYFIAGGLWQSDGTTAGTHVVISSQKLTVQEVEATSHLIFFTANNATNGKVELWRSDGTAAGSYPVWTKPSGVFNRPGYLTALGDVILFIADDGVHGMELWQSDGSEVGTGLLHDMTPGAVGSAVSAMVADDEWAYLVAAFGAELWRSDGTAVHTTLLPNPNDCANATYDSLALGEKQLFLTVTCHEQPQLRVIHGGETEMTLLHVAAEDPAYDKISLKGFGLGYLFFNVTNGRSYPEKAALWASDGTATGTMLIQDFTPEKLAFPAFPHDLQEINGNIYFAAYAGYDKGVELWSLGAPRQQIYLPLITASP